MNTGHLDYPIDPPIVMVAETHVEREWRLKACAKEPETVAWIEGFAPGDVLWDVGANVGSYSLLAARLGARVYAFEPASANYSHLCANVRINDLQAICRPFLVAIGSNAGWVELNVSPVCGGAKAHSTLNGKPYFETIAVVNGQEFDRPTHIKIDVDGGEMDVLEALRPVLPGATSVLVELAPENEADGTAILTGMGYTVTGRHARWQEKAWNVVFRRDSE